MKSPLGATARQKCKRCGPQSEKGTAQELEQPDPVPAFDFAALVKPAHHVAGADNLDKVIARGSKRLDEHVVRPLKAGNFR